MTVLPIRRLTQWLAVLFLGSSSIATAAPITVDFEFDPLGSVGNGFTAAETSGLSFFDTAGEDLLIGDFGAQSDGNALAVGGDQDGSALLMLFVDPLDFLSLDFGNDDPASTNAGDLAWLSLFLGEGNLVAQVILELNRDDVMNQTISAGEIGGGLFFDRAEFAFTNTDGSLFTGGGAANVGSTEIVDNIVYNVAERDDPVPVAEPPVLALFCVGLVALFGVRRQRSLRC